MDEITKALQLFAQSMAENWPLTLTIVGALWLITLINAAVGYRFNLLGIHPRKWYGIPGIVCAPFLHGGFNHLFFNSIPLFVLLNLILMYGIPMFYCVTSVIIVISGVLSWLFARPGIHVGASGVIMGYLGFLLVLAYFQPTTLTIVTAAVAFYYFGSLLLGLFPQTAEVSWEGHIFGFIGGLAAVYLCTKAIP